MRYPKSIMADDMGKCHLCGSTRDVQIHHVFGGPFRDKSAKYGLVVPLCRECHEGPHGVHMDAKKMAKLREEGQRKFQEAHPDLDFMAIFRRNWIP